MLGPVDIVIACRGLSASTSRGSVRLHFEPVFVGSALSLATHIVRIAQTRRARWLRWPRQCFLGRVPSGGVRAPAACLLARPTCSGRRNAPPPGLWIIADLVELFRAHVAGPARRPLVVLLQRQRADEAHDRRPQVGEDGDDVGAPLDLAVQASSGLVDSCGQCSFGNAR
jgi:hypothetical protein